MERKSKLLKNETIWIENKKLKFADIIKEIKGFALIKKYNKINN